MPWPPERNQKPVVQAPGSSTANEVDSTRMAYWADEAVADRKDRPAFLLALFTYARAGMSEYFGRKAQTNNTTP